MLQELQGTLIRPVSFEEMVIGLCMACLCGVIISLFYRWTYRGTSYAPTFVRSLIFLSMITAVVILVIGNNLARAFGLVGAMSIIRFRTPVKDAQDIVFIFFSLAAGMASGVGLHALALTSTLFIGIVIFVSTKLDFAVMHKEAFLLQFSYQPVDGEEAPYLSVLRTHCRKHELLNVSASEETGALDLMFYVYLRRRKEQEAFVRELAGSERIQHVNLYYDNPDAGI